MSLHADEPTRDAIDIVARRILADLAEGVRTGHYYLLDWSDFPEIGEDDWIAVCDRLGDLAPYVDAEQHEAAYEHLASRAKPA